MDGLLVVRADANFVISACTATFDGTHVSLLEGYDRLFGKGQGIIGVKDRRTESPPLNRILCRVL